MDTLRQNPTTERTDNDRNGSISDEFGWRIFRIMSEFVEGFQLIRELKNTVSFFGSARFRETNKHYREAVELGELLGKDGYTIVTGGGPGIMEAGNRGAHNVKAPSVGLNIELPQEQHVNPYVTRTLGFHYFFTRKVMLSYAAQAYVFFPGGYGTLNELSELLTLVQTKKIEPIPIILIGRDFWKPFIEWVRVSMYEFHKAVDAEDMKLFHLAQNVEEAHQIILNIGKKGCQPQTKSPLTGYQAKNLDKQEPKNGALEQ
jgi:uncharacterized protein (TIGR00730 family)